MPAQIQIPHEFMEAARAVEIAAVKWGDVADRILHWHVIAVFALGLLAGLIIAAFWSSE